MMTRRGHMRAGSSGCWTYLGHKNMSILNGGWQKWVSEKRDASEAIPDVQPAKYEAALDNKKIATGQWLLENLTNSGIAVLDVRSHNEFTGEDARSARGGHIPGAIHLDWNYNLTEQGTIKSATDLRNMFCKAQINKEKEIVIHCQTGIRGAQSYFVLRLMGYENVRLYDGSWEEWGNDTRYPVEKGIGNATGETTLTC